MKTIEEAIAALRRPESAPIKMIDQNNPFALRSHNLIRFTISGELTAAELATVRRILDRVNAKINFGDGDWRQVNDWAMHLAMSEFDDVMLEQRLLPEWVPSDLQYRQRVRRVLRAMKSRLKDGDLCSALEYAVAIGALMCEAQLHGELARYTRIGRDVRRGGRKGAHRAHGQVEPTKAKYEKYRRSFDRHRAKGLSKTAAYEAVAREHRTTDRTVRKAITGC